MKRVSTGTKSLLLGVHQFLWHPIMVLLAWLTLYGRPNMQEMVCIFVHDWGYAGKRSMDGEDGVLHPELGARIAGFLFGKKYEAMVLGHSRAYSRLQGIPRSKLCYADKLSIVYEPAGFYLLRAWVSGELKEYRMESAESGFVPMSESHRKWLRSLKDSLRIVAMKESGRSLKSKEKENSQTGTKNLISGISEAQ